jgi:hypothetical protein
MLLLLILPAIYLTALVVLFVNRSRTGIAISLGLVVVTVAASWWAIMQSRSSTASLGFLGVPTAAAAAGLFGLAYGRWARSPERPRKMMGFVSLGAAILLILTIIREGIGNRRQAEALEDTQARTTAEIDRNRELIAAALSDNKGRERAYLDSAIRSRMNDRAFLIAALPNDSISPDILDTLANSPDMGVALAAVRNRGTQGATLARVYREKSYPDYFFQALASHLNTPPEILRSIYRKPGVISGLEVWLVANPATPRDVLEDISSKAK